MRCTRCLDPDPDTISGTISNDKINGTASGQNSEGVSSHTVEVEWFNESMIGNVSGVSKSNIIQGLEGGENGLGSYTFRIKRHGRDGRGAGCSHTDEGEDIEYIVELVILDYVIQQASQETDRILAIN